MINNTGSCVKHQWPKFCEVISNIWTIKKYNNFLTFFIICLTESLTMNKYYHVGLNKKGFGQLKGEK